MAKYIDLYWRWLEKPDPGALKEFNALLKRNDHQAIHFEYYDSPKEREQLLHSYWRLPFCSRAQLHKLMVEAGLKLEYRWVPQDHLYPKDVKEEEGAINGDYVAHHTISGCKAHLAYTTAGERPLTKHLKELLCFCSAEELTLIYHDIARRLHGDGASDGGTQPNAHHQEDPTEPTPDPH